MLSKMDIKKERHSMEERFRSIGSLLSRRSGTMERSKDLQRTAKPIYEGWLSKEGRNVLSLSKWHKKYFVLHETELLYWNTEEDCRSGQTPRGIIDLTGCSLAVIDEKKHANTFGIYHPERRDYLLGAQNKRELMIWVKKMELALLGRERRVPSLIDFELLKLVGKGASGVVLQVFIEGQYSNSYPLNNSWTNGDMSGAEDNVRANLRYEGCDIPALSLCR